MESSFESSNIQIGDLVWAKMKGYPPWPGRVVKPGPNVKKGNKKGMHWIYFFGTCDNAWIEDNQIKPYQQHFEKFSNGSKNAKFKAAIQEIEDFIKKWKEDPNYEIPVLANTSQNEEVLEEETSASSPTPKKPRKSAVKRPARDSSTPKMSTPKRIRENSFGIEENGISSGSLLKSINANDKDDSQIITADDEDLDDSSVGKQAKSYGFLGLGNIGGAIVKNLVDSGHKLYIWNRTTDKSEAIRQYADNKNSGLVTICDVPYDVMRDADIVFSCLADPKTAKEAAYGNCGVVPPTASMDSLKGKGYVEMTGVDPDTSKDIRERIENCGGRYLEAQVQGSKSEAESANLIILTAGDKTLFKECQGCFKAMGKTAFYLGAAGYATKVNLILQLMKGIALAGLAEGFALADRSGISSKDLLKIFNLTNLANPFLTGKAQMIIDNEFSNVEQAVELMQKDMNLALNLSDQMKQPLLMAATANEVYKHARRLGYDGRDAACIYRRIRH